MAYSLIESADEWKARERKKIRFETLQKAIIIIIILIFGTFIAAQLIVQSIHNGSLLSTPTSAIYRSLPGTVQLINGTFRTAIGGQFHCSRRLLIPSPTSPTDANQVRPADIKYIAAMGDSYLTGYLSWTERMADDERWVPNAVGNSFITGGDGEMEGHLTLANILRRLNPSLTGFSTGIGLQEEQSGLNVAVPGMWVDDLQRQARELIRRFRKFSEESLKNEWKLIHIFIGSRDIGGYCEGQGETTKADYKRNFTLAITTLQEALPKTIISIIGLANMDFLFNAASIIRGTKFRPCKNIDFQLLAQRRIDQYREANIEIIAEMGLKSRPDHVVITHNIFDDLWQPLRKADGSFNIEFYAEDLYHLSNYGNSLIAKQLWNQLNSPEQRKLTTNALLTDESRELQCPEYRCPFIRTPSNSVHCVMSDENVIAGTYTDVDFR
ncbi:hypothetical protein PRIPAC_75760 [Pristionchus pacificus]|uniref:Lipase n=1 Tax=Pristionchus pacificus TaxID=54126 RepID=A0A2A6BF60_PRIPA|nr:hypothetical protein PRIPAC_75760 [Pristionchus pacificus]|eukprot:PDM64519.1 lipase [Pristionchus pacificus]